MRYKSKVMTGFGRGKTIGFPTYNLEIPENFKFQHGIYAIKIKIRDQEYAGAMHFGPIPTFDVGNPALEVFVIDYSETAPVQSIRFEIKGFIRPIQKFTNPLELKNQIANDVSRIRQILR